MSAILVGESDLTIEEVIRIAQGKCGVSLPEDAGFRERVDASVAVLDAALARGEPVYGVSRGFGSSCEAAMPADLWLEVPRNLVRFHGCGVGPWLTEEQSAAVLVVRLAGLARGFSGVRMELLTQLCGLINRRILPCIPSQGSVGASGDLTPLSYVAAVVMGEREAMFQNERLPAATALARSELKPLVLAPKESLALMNGTSAMAGLACFAIKEAAQLARLASALTAMTCEVIHGNAHHFDERTHALKAHPGQVLCAGWLREDLEYRPGQGGGARLQDRYSVRCAPHIIGVLLDTLEFARRLVTVEINSVNDNPLLDPFTGRVLSGGNFYGGHVCQAMDALKTAVAGVADLMDRQLLLLCDPHTSDGLPAGLVAARDIASSIHFGFKAMQITASALAAEALKLTIPASAFSRSTEGHNQDKVSMGTIAARDCLQILEWTRTTACVHLLALCQAVDLRGDDTRGRRSRELHGAVRAHVPTVSADRPMDGDINLLLALLRDDALPVGGYEQIWAGEAERGA